MGSFLHMLLTPGFLQHALLAALLAGFACGIVGTYVVVRRIGYMAGGIAHSVLGGMGIAYFLGADPLLGAVIAALLAALAIGWISLHWKQHEDVIISAVWAVGMALGILFIARTPGYNVDLLSFLFGNILMVSSRDLAVMAMLDLVVLCLVTLFYKQFLAVCFDEEFARTRGVDVNLFHLLLLCLVAVTVVSLIRVVGLILVIALLALPAATMRQFVRSILGMMVGACLLGMLFGATGLAVSFATDLPSGAIIVLLAGCAFLLSLALSAVLRRARRRVATDTR